MTREERYEEALSISKRLLELVGSTQVEDGAYCFACNCKDQPRKRLWRYQLEDRSMYLCSGCKRAFGGRKLEESGVEEKIAWGAYVHHDLSLVPYYVTAEIMAKLLIKNSVRNERIPHPH